MIFILRSPCVNVETLAFLLSLSLPVTRQPRRLFPSPRSSPRKKDAYTMAENQATFKMVLCGDGGTVSAASG